MSENKIKSTAMDHLFGGLSTPSPAQEASPAAASPGTTSTKASKKTSSKTDEYNKLNERVCTIVSSDLMNKVRYIVGQERIAIRDVFEAGLRMAIEEYERNYGRINVTPGKRQRGSVDIFFKKKP